MQQLPIEQCLEPLKRALSAERNVVLIAEPGAGKSTRVPLALLEEPWLAGQRMIMLEPRRLAAKSVAAYMSKLLGEPLGATVGYRVKQDARVSGRTRIEVVTEGILTRMLQDDPTLEGVGLLLFDEFHERSLHADIGLAFALQAQQLLREDLRIVAMSATLEAEPAAQLLGGAPILRSAGRAHPVEVRYVPKPERTRLEEHAANVALQAANEEPGDMLVFLPGIAEINRTMALIRQSAGGRFAVLPLHGGLPLAEQEAALAPAEGLRRIVLATTIAETSLTVEGVRIVIDGGLKRASRFSPRTGMSRLETVTVSQASADQRKGRAGRLEPGVCYRLWSAQAHERLPLADTPEILEADLAALVLETARWGASDPDELAWLNPPPAPAVQQARELLLSLGALDDGGRLTGHGRRMSGLGMHPRMSHMLLRGVELGWGQLACELAALLEERDLLRAELGSANADIRLRLEALGDERAGDPQAKRRVRAEAERRMRELGAGRNERTEDRDAAAGLLLAFAYPDRIGMRRVDGRYLLSNGRGAAFANVQPLSQEPLIVAVQVNDVGTDSRIELAAPIGKDQLERRLSEAIRIEERVQWDKERGSVQAKRVEKLGAIVLWERPISSPNPERVTEALMDGIRQEGLELLPWTKPSMQLRQRMRFMRHIDPVFPDAEDEALLAGLEQWLAPFAGRMRSRSDLQRIPMHEALKSMLSWTESQQLERWAPTHIVVPSGSRIAVNYDDPRQPVLAVKLQEVFGLADTPSIADGRVPLTMHLLSPAGRPVQVTQDLASFWRQTYFEVRKDLRGRYPKHYWPEDPWSAQATNRVRPRG